MKAGLALSLFIAVLVSAGVSQAVTTEHFHVMTTRDLVDLCDSPTNDPLHREAVHFCVGYIVGAYCFYNAERASDPGRTVCLPNPGPSRDAATMMFVQWAKAHPQYMGERPVDTLFRFMEATWPCKR
jgi:hypothetical protein